MFCSQSYNLTVILINFDDYAGGGHSSWTVEIPWPPPSSIKSNVCDIFPSFATQTPHTTNHASHCYLVLYYFCRVYDVEPGAM